MNLPNSIVSDKSLKSILILGVITVIGTSLITQIMLQTGENVREYSVDLSDQVPGSDNYFNSLAVYPNGLPPYISSGGVYSPEITIFNIGFKIAGILFIFIGIEAFFDVDFFVLVSIRRGKDCLENLQILFRYPRRCCRLLFEETDFFK